MVSRVGLALPTRGSMVIAKVSQLVESSPYQVRAFFTFRFKK